MESMHGPHISKALREAALTRRVMFGAINTENKLKISRCNFSSNETAKIRSVLWNGKSALFLQYREVCYCCEVKNATKAFRRSKHEYRIKPCTLVCSNATSKNQLPFSGSFRTRFKVFYTHSAFEQNRYRSLKSATAGVYPRDRRAHMFFKLLSVTAMLYDF